MTGSEGVLSVPGEHLPGMVWLVAVPVGLWLVLSLLRLLAARDVAFARRLMSRIDGLSLAAKTAVFAALVGAGVHAAIVPTHWTEDRTRAWLFVLDTLAFCVAIAATLLGVRHWRLISVAVLAGTVGTYTLYLLKGRETLDLVGLLTTTIELAALLVLLDPRVPAQGPTRSRDRWIVVAALPLAFVALLGTGAVASATVSAEHHHGADDEAGHHEAGHHDDGHDGMAGMSGMPVAEHPGGHDHAGGTGTGQHLAGDPDAWALATRSPAGDIRWPASMSGMRAGMRMVTGGCLFRPSAAQQQAAVRLVDATVAGVSPYQSLAAAKAAGYVPVTPSGRPVVHYVNPAALLAADGLNPTGVPSLVYANTSHGAVLVAAMYMLVGTPAADLPQPGGCLTQWHVHTDLCFSGGTVVATDDRAPCPAGSERRITPPMMHVWLAPVPGGPLAMDATDRAAVAAAARLPHPAHDNGRA